ncbi:tail component of prophage [Escherichia coli]|nr:tail component of prophage [Escherichia coli]
MNFGSRSEKVSRRIAQMEADLKALQKESDTLTGRVDDPAVQRPLRQTRTRKPFPESLPRDEKRLLPAASCCPECGGSLSYLGEDAAEQLELMRSAFLKRLFAVSITSSGNPPTFSLTPEGKLTARNADISGAITANTGTLNNVTINENCVIRGKLSANQIEGDLVKTVGKAFPRNNSYASGTVTVTVYDDQGFDRQIIIPPVLFRGTKHQNFNSPNQQSYWYSTCKLQVLKNGVEIFHEPATDVSRVFSSVIDMPAGRGHVTLTFNVSSAGANNWTPTTYISDLLVVVMKKSTAGISIS